MESSRVLFTVILGLVVGGLTVLLAVAYASTEKERAQQEMQRRAEAAAAKVDIRLGMPGFFPPAHAAAAPIAFAFDDGVVRQLENHLRSEQAAVAQFVHQPSIDNLYRQPIRALQLH